MLRKQLLRSGSWMERHLSHGNVCLPSVSPSWLCSIQSHALGSRPTARPAPAPTRPVLVSFVGTRRQQRLSVLLTEDSSAPSPGQAHSTRSTNFSSKTTWAFAEGVPAYLLSLSPCPHATGVTPPCSSPNPFLGNHLTLKGTITLRHLCLS